MAYLAKDLSVLSKSGLGLVNMSLSCPFLFKITYHQNLKLCLQKVSERQTACFGRFFLPLAFISS